MGNGTARQTRTEPSPEPPSPPLPYHTVYAPKPAETGLKSLSRISNVDVVYGETASHLKPGENVLVMDAGAGMLAYTASQRVTNEGKVLAITHCVNKLALARSCLEDYRRETNLTNLEFKQVKATELSLDLEKYLVRMRELLEQRNAAEMADLKRIMRKSEPPIEFDSFDSVISNAWLRFKDEEEKEKYFQGVFEALRKGGHAVLSTVVADESVPDEFSHSEELLGEGHSHILTEGELLEAFEHAGFYGIQLLWRDTQPWKTIHHIEFRRCTVEAFKGKQGPCKERFQALMYKGPFKEVLDDDHHRFQRGKRYAVCDKTYNLYLKPPYVQDFVALPPNEEIPLSEAKPFACNVAQIRDPKLTKGFDIERQGSEMSLTDLG